MTKSYVCFCAFCEAQFLGRMLDTSCPQCAAQGIEAGTAETVEQDSVHESPVAKPCAQPEDTPQ